MVTSYQASRLLGSRLAVKLDPRKDNYSGVFLPANELGMEKTRYATGRVMKIGPEVLKELGLRYEDEIINRRVAFRNYLKDGTQYGLRDADNLPVTILFASSIELVIGEDTEITTF